MVTLYLALVECLLNERTSEKKRDGQHESTSTPQRSRGDLAPVISAGARSFPFVARGPCIRTSAGPSREKSERREWRTFMGALSAGNINRAQVVVALVSGKLPHINNVAQG